jgi:hypothetical protein
MNVAVSLLTINDGSLSVIPHDFDNYHVAIPSVFVY